MFVPPAPPHPTPARQPHNLIKKKKKFLCFVRSQLEISPPQDLPRQQNAVVPSPLTKHIPIPSWASGPMGRWAGLRCVTRSSKRRRQIRKQSHQNSLSRVSLLIRTRKGKYLKKKGNLILSVYYYYFIYLFINFADLFFSPIYVSLSHAFSISLLFLSNSLSPIASLENSSELLISPAKTDSPSPFGGRIRLNSAIAATSLVCTALLFLKLSEIVVIT